MNPLILLLCFLALCYGQLVDPRDAKILREQRFNAGDGRAGSAFATENGVVFKEETDASGNRIGQYSYVGQDGQTYTVKYSAGTDGFRILEGDHIVATGREAAAFNAQNDDQVLSAAPPVVAQNPVVVVDYDDDDDDVNGLQQDDPNRNPFVNPHDPTHRNFAFNQNGADFEPKSRPNSVAQLNANSVPNCADCQGVNPFVNPFDASHAGLLAGHQAGFVQPQQHQQQRAQPPQPALPAQRFVPQISSITSTTVAPRFFPPGQLKLNRFETGFNFDFES